MINVTSVASEPYSGSSIIVKIAIAGFYDQVKDSLIFGAAALLTIIVLVLIATLCNLIINRPTMMKYEDQFYRSAVPAVQHKINTY